MRLFLPACLYSSLPSFLPICLVFLPPSFLLSISSFFSSPSSPPHSPPSLPCPHQLQRILLLIIFSPLDMATSNSIILHSFVFCYQLNFFSIQNRDENYQCDCTKNSFMTGTHQRYYLSVTPADQSVSLEPSLLTA